MGMVLPPCKRCRNLIPLDSEYCPHCGGDLNCPNVILAEQPENLDELENQYKTVLADVDLRGARPVLDEFELRLAVSRAVLGSKLEKLMPIVTEDRDLFPPFYELQRLRFYRETKPGDPDWNKLRPIAEIHILGSAKHLDKLHYAALSLDDRSLPHYGECTIVLRDEMIAHRSSVFQENSAVFVHRHGNQLPPGSRAPWANRAKLCVSKLASQIHSGTKPVDFPGLLLKSGPTGVDDEFVEVHIFGPMTFRTFEKITIKKQVGKQSGKKRPRQHRGVTTESAIQDYCRNSNVICEFV